MAVVLTEEYVFQMSGAEGGQGGALVIGKITLDSAYPTNGSVIDPPGGVDYIEMVVGGGSVSTKYDVANKKLLCYASNGAAPALLAEVANTTNISANVCSFVAIRPA
jgi:hypothetical protein